MDIKAQIKNVADSLTKDPQLLQQFQKEPVKAVEKLLGKDLPDEVIQQVIDAVKAKISVDKLSGLGDAVKKLL